MRSPTANIHTTLNQQMRGNEKLGFPTLDPLISHHRARSDLQYMATQVKKRGYNPKYQIYPDDSTINLNENAWGPQTVMSRNKIGGYRIDKKELVSASVNFDNLKRNQLGARILFSNQVSPRSNESMSPDRNTGNMQFLEASNESLQPSTTQSIVELSPHKNIDKSSHLLQNEMSSQLNINPFNAVSFRDSQDQYLRSGRNIFTKPSRHLLRKTV